MIVNYMYATKWEDGRTKIHGPYDVDKADFENFFKNRLPGIRWIRVTFLEFNQTKRCYDLYKYYWTRNYGWSERQKTRFDNYVVASALVLNRKDYV